VRGRQGALLLAGATGLLSGCAGPVSYGTSETVACTVGDEAEPSDGVILMAQAVPSSPWVPCLEGMPLGWHLADLQAGRGQARFSLTSDRHGARALEVTLTTDCDTSEATEIPSEREGMRRFERVRELSPNYVGTRMYEFDGGCIALSFTIASEDRAEPLGVASQGIGVISREDLRAHVRAESRGRLELDPPPAEEGTP
jgi:hypothetical protein